LTLPVGEKERKRGRERKRRERGREREKGGRGRGGRRGKGRMRRRGEEGEKEGEGEEEGRERKREKGERKGDYTLEIQRNITTCTLRSNKIKPFYSNNYVLTLDGSLAALGWQNVVSRYRAEIGNKLETFLVTQL
jgi:hypothetical protein